MPNELSLGTRRVGDFIDFYPETPLVKVTLERSEKGIWITIPWSDSNSTHARWFTDDSGQDQPLPVPRRVQFVDSRGSVLLIRCWPRGFHTNLGGPGSGTLWAKAAILGPRKNLEFERPHGLQTEISGLRAWLRATSWKEEHSWQGSHSATLSSQDLSPIQVGTHNGVAVEFWPAWQIVREEGGDRRVVMDMMRCVTLSGEPLEWDKHRQTHRAIRDLLVLSRWNSVPCVEVFARRDDDTILTSDGEEHSGQWREVVVRKDDRTAPLVRDGAHLLRYDELQEAGVLRWLGLRDEFSRALDPVITSIDLRGTTEMTMLAHTGPGLEALGYLLMVRDCVAPKALQKASLRMKLDRIVRDLGDCLPFDSSTWASATVATYNGLKHANRAEPDAVDVANVWRESVMVVRAWVALELGVPLDKVKERLADDAQGYPYVRIQ